MTKTLLLRLFVPYALGNMLSAFYRTVMAVVAPDLIDTLDLDAEDLGLVTSVYFLVFAAVQLPLGVLLDRFGARAVSTVLFGIAAAGSLLFATAGTVPSLALARGLMGLGMSVALMGGFKAMIDWLPRDKVPFGNGLLLMSGGLGTMSATAPVEWALAITDWRGVFLVLGAATLVIAVMIVVTVPEKPRTPSRPSMVDAVRGIVHVYGDANFQRYAPLGAMVMGASISLTGLWAGPWLRDVEGLSRDEIANLLFAMAAMMTASVFLSGAVAERLARAGIASSMTAGVGIACFMTAQAGIVLNPDVNPYALWLPLAFFGSAPVLFYTVLTDCFPVIYAGRVTTAYNSITFACVFAAQWAIGAIIDLFPHVADGRFAPTGYRTALGVMIGVELLAFAWFALAPRFTSRR